MSANRGNIAWHLHNMISAPAGLAAVKTIFKSEDGILLAYGKTVPDALADYAPGCIFIHVDGSAGGTLYVNEGDATTSDFNTVGSTDSLATLLAEGSTLATALQSQTKGIEAAYPHALVAGSVGPSPLIWDGAPIEEVIMDPTKGYYYWEDFLVFDCTTACGIIITQTHADGTLANNPAVEGGILTFDTGGATDTDGPTVQWTGLQIMPQAGTTIYFECRVKISADDCRAYIGLADDAATDYVSDDSVDITKNQVGFFRDSSCDSTDDMSTILSRADAEEITDTCITELDNDYNTFGIVVDGLTSVTFYVNGSVVETSTTVASIPNGVICPILQVNTDGTTQLQMYLDWMRILVYDADGSCRET